jgi:hypothetical protein
MPAAADQVYRRLVDDDEDHGCGDLPEAACREVPGSALKLVAALTRCRRSATASSTPRRYWRGCSRRSGRRPA